MMCIEVECEEVKQNTSSQSKTNPRKAITRIILTPVTEKSEIKYLLESLYFTHETDTSPLWDDTRANNAEVSKFGFVHNDIGMVELFEVIAILRPEVRPTHWTIEEHHNRRVLVLSKRIKRVNFLELKRVLGYPLGLFIRDTMRLNKQWNYECEQLENINELGGTVLVQSLILS